MNKEYFINIIFTIFKDKYTKFYLFFFFECVQGKLILLIKATNTLILILYTKKNKELILILKIL